MTNTIYISFCAGSASLVRFPKIIHASCDLETEMCACAEYAYRHNGVAANHLKTLSTWIKPSNDVCVAWATNESYLIFNVDLDVAQNQDTLTEQSLKELMSKNDAVLIWSQILDEWQLYSSDTHEYFTGSTLQEIVNSADNPYVSKDPRKTVDEGFELDSNVTNPLRWVGFSYTEPHHGNTYYVRSVVRDTGNEIMFHVVRSNEGATSVTRCVNETYLFNRYIDQLKNSLLDAVVRT